jgi:hypothetical protein
MSLSSLNRVAERSFKLESRAGGYLVWLFLLMFLGLPMIGMQASGQEGMQGYAGYVASLGLLLLYPVPFLMAALFVPISVTLGHSGVKRVMCMMAFGGATLVAVLPLLAVLNAQAVLDKLGIQTTPWATLQLSGRSFADVLSAYTIIGAFAVFLIRALSLRGSTLANSDALQTNVRHSMTIKSIMFTPRLAIRLTKASARIVAKLFGGLRARAQSKMAKPTRTAPAATSRQSVVTPVSLAGEPVPGNFFDQFTASGDDERVEVAELLYEDPPSPRLSSHLAAAPMQRPDGAIVVPRGSLS